MQFSSRTRAGDRGGAASPARACPLPLTTYFSEPASVIDRPWPFCEVRCGQERTSTEASTGVRPCEDRRHYTLRTA
jgi:hypothetical protein